MITVQSDIAIIAKIDLDELIGLKHTDIEIERISAFMSEFCPTGRTYLARIFVRGRLYKKTVDEILAVCTEMRNDTWVNSTSGRFGDPDDVACGGIGMKNTAAYYQAYKNLGLPRPKFLF